MGTKPYALGRNVKFFSKIEGDLGGSFATASQEMVTGADAAKVTACDMGLTIERVNREDAFPSRSLVERVSGRQEISWSCESYILPAGGSTAPDIDPLLAGAFGTAFAANTYALSEGSGGATGLPSVHLARVIPGLLREDIYGAWVNDWGLTVSGGDLPKMTFGGGAMHYAMTSTGIAGTGTTTALGPPIVPLPITVVAGTSNGGAGFMPGSVIDVGNDAEVIVKDVVADDLTMATAFTFATSDAVTPTSYTEATTGNPATSTAGTISFAGSVAYNITSFDVTLSNGVKPLGDVAFESGAVDYIPMMRTVTGNVSIRAREDAIRAFGLRTARDANGFTHATVAITVTIGSVDGEKTVVTIPKAELDFSNIAVPTAEEAVLNIPFTALGNTGGDELSLAWNQS